MSFFKEKTYKIFEDSPLMTFDLNMVSYRTKIDSPFFDTIFKFFATIDTNYVVLIPFYGAFLYYNHTIEFISALILSVLVSDQTCLWLFKKPIRRFRPVKWFAVVEEKTGKKPDELMMFLKFSDAVAWRANSSMCSSHAANFFVQALIIQFYFPIVTPYLLIAFLLVGIGRWYIGAHWASDVLCGWLIGFFAYIITVNTLSWLF